MAGTICVPHHWGLTGDGIMTYTELNENPGGVSHMRKGEAKRQEMLAAAERLFCTKGYDATSVQDILDVLRSLKGHGFKNGVEQFFISGYEFLDIFFYGNFFPKIIKKYGLDLKERK